ncbi:hypothetical protein RU84_14200 [Acinetobacter baumannii]|uniref:hypothetical protein n=1 Tax=Acinetobacter baumannii TaxID=470 RepID=UPI00057D219D|nr:hypothetical protein [Acinetobacter baumannii]AJB67979.1 hypothetical protein RU84_14200 [Acinetobacter baumannii]KQD43438.1 hypothetical protein APD15_07515 [Acinetobacter baumannii]
MKPEQFIREFGVEKSRAVVEGAPDGHKGYNGVINQYTRGVWFSRDVMLSDLKRLVESVDIINELGSLRSAKSNVREMYVDSSCDYVHPEARLYDYKHLRVGRVMKAIADHESIYGASHE